jgi:hypothetical protein
MRFAGIVCLYARCPDSVIAVAILFSCAVTRAWEIADANGSAEEEQRKQVEAKKEAVSDMLKRMMGH